MAATAALRVAEHLAVQYRRTWQASIATSFLVPLLFLLGMGVGLGGLIEGERAVGLGGVPYLAFVAPGLLAASAMQTAANESTFPVMAGFRWQRTYVAMLNAPIGVDDVVAGHLAWVTVRLLLASAAFLGVVAAFDVVASWTGLLAVPAAMLTGLAFAAPVTAFTAVLKHESGLSTLLRFGILPMFLFSGTFFPIGQLPGWMQVVARVTPLWHGVELCRSLVLGRATAAGSVGHVAYLAVWVVAGWWLAVVALRRRMVT